MKISSASKKVLASALSAAMVVAFAPTVAMANISYGTQVNVKFDLNGGSLPAGSAVSSVADGTGTASVDGKTLTVIADANSFAAASASKDGAQFDGWFYDADGNGKYDDSKGDVAYNATASTLDVSSIAQTSEITLKAKYAYAADLQLQSNNPTINTAASASDTTIGYKLAGNYTSGYTFEGVGPDGATIEGSQINGGTGASPVTYVTFDLAGHLASGTYTFSVKNAAKTVVAQATADVVKVTLDAAGYGTFGADAVTEYYVTKDTAVKDLAKLTVPAKAGDASFVAYYDADGNKVTADYTSGDTIAADSNATGEIKKDATLTAVYSNAQVVKAAYKGDVLTFGVQKPADETSIEDYTATVTGPNGFSKSWNIAKANIASPTLTFGATFEGVTAEGGAAYKTKDAAAAGTYTLSVAANATKDASEAGAQMPSVASKSVDVAAVTFDINGGSWKADVTEKGSVAKAAYDAVVKLYQADKQTVKGLQTAAEALVSSYVKAPEGKVVDSKSMTYNGAKIADVKGTDKVGASGLVIKAAYKDGVAAPTLSSKTADGTKYKLVFAAASGKVQYSTDNSNWYNLPSDGTVTVSNSQALYVKAVDASGNSSDVLTYRPSASAVSDFDAFAVSALNAKTAESTGTTPVTYGSVLKTAKADGEKALKEIGYAEESEWAAEVVKQEKAVVEAMAKHATDKLAEAKVLTASKDGKTYSYVTDAAYETAVASINATVAAFDANNDKDYANNVKVNKKSSGITGADYAADITKAGTDAAKVTVSADDAKAAIAVTDALKAAKTGAEAKAAVEAYNKLTDAQKALVSSADVAAAQEIVSKAEADEAAKALVEAQDEAAVAAVKGKTVKAKAKKKTTASLKAVTSKSGAVTTFAKTSGNAKIKVSAAGKITVKKGLKAGKKYTAKVKATVGTATKTVKVVVKVAK